MDEKSLSQKSIYEGRIVSLSVHDVRLPDGTIGKREVIHHSGAVAMVTLDDKQNVLLVRQFRFAAGQDNAGNSGWNARR